MNNRLKSGFGFYLILLIVLCLGVYFYYLNSQNTTDEYTVNQFEQDLKAGDVTKIVIKQNEEVPTGVVAASIKGKGTKQFYVSDVTSVVDHVTSDYSDVEVHMTDVDRPSIWVSILPYILMTVVFVFVFFMMTAGAGGGGGGNSRMMNFSKSKAKVIRAEDMDVDFTKVAGLQEEKEEVREIVDFLKEPQRFMDAGARIPKGVIMVGPPGSGKSMMAKRLPSILPPLTLSESLETTQIHSIAGKLGKNVSLISQRPFRAPHHTISQVALVGGGTSPQPGEISLAHNGVLFCDELPEFNKTTLEVLRQPLEDRHINISRAKYSIDYPCSFMFVASMNPCPCGYYGDPTHKCVCTPGQIQRYMNKISGPLLDRIDIQCEISPVPFKDISKAAPGEPSANIRERVIKAREIQANRFKDFKGIHCNAQMTERMIHQFAEPTEEGINLLRMAMEKLSLSARAYNRILKVARTIADLAGCENVEPQHLAEAIGYRTLDRGDWAERGQL